MKRDLFIALAVVMLCGGCKKNSQTPAPAASNPYFPVTTGFSWTYLHYEEGLSGDTATVKITGGKTDFNGKTYYNAATASSQTGLGTDYFYAGDHIYTIRSLNAYVGEVVELELYNDTATVGHSNITYPTENGMIANSSVRTVNTIEETNLSLTVAGKPYTGLIHTHVDFQFEYKKGDGYLTNFAYDFYLAKGIGMVAYNVTFLGSQVEAEFLSDYKVN